MVKVRENLVGKTFNRLTVIQQVDDYIKPNGEHVAQWLCKCSCSEDKFIIVYGENLKNGHTKSCGCLVTEKLIQRNVGNTYGSLTKKYNQYNLSGDFGIGYTDKGEEFYFDLEDYEKIKDYCWHIDKDGYVVANCDDTTIKMHRVIMSCKSNELVDHKKHKTNDNRKSELRKCSNSENSFNKAMLNSNKSGCTGVWWNEQRQKWEAYIKAGRKKIHLGRFNDFDDAVKARKIAEEKYFGEFSYNNSMKE